MIIFLSMIGEDYMDRHEKEAAYQLIVHSCLDRLLNNGVLICTTIVSIWRAHICAYITTALSVEFLFFFHQLLFN
jgi:hypothetical protein